MPFYVSSLDNEEIMMIWFGGSVSPQLLRDLLDVDDLLQVNPQLVWFFLSALLVHDAYLLCVSHRQDFRNFKHTSRYKFVTY